MSRLIFLPCINGDAVIVIVTVKPVKLRTEVDCGGERQYQQRRRRRWRDSNVSHSRSALVTAHKRRHHQRLGQTDRQTDRHWLTPSPLTRVRIGALFHRPRASTATSYGTATATVQHWHGSGDTCSLSLCSIVLFLYIEWIKRFYRCVSLLALKWCRRKRNDT